MRVLGRDIVFNWSMAEFVESYLIDERLQAWQFERWSESFGWPRHREMGLRQRSIVPIRLYVSGFGIAGSV